MVKITAVKNWIKDNGDFEKLGVKVKMYLPINDKLTLVHKILQLSTIEEDGVQKVNAIYKRLFYEIEMIRAYGNLDFSTIDKLLVSDKEEDRDKYSDKLTTYYDDLKQSGLIDTMLRMIDVEEVRFIDECINEQIIENNRANNSIAGVVGGALNKLIEKIPNEATIGEWLKALPDLVNKIDKGTLKDILEVAKFNSPSKAVK